MKIAISYRRADDSETLQLLVREVRTRFGDQNVYLDLESTRVGENWMVRWLEAYGSADCILLVIGPRWNPERLQQTSDPVLNEVFGRWDRVIPVLIDGATFPRREQLPRAMRPLLMRQGYVIDPQSSVESIARFVQRLEVERQPPSGWEKHSLSFRTQEHTTSFDLTGGWELESKATVPFANIYIKQNGKVLNLWALGSYADEIVGEGYAAIQGPTISITLASKQYGPAGMLVLKYDTKSAMLTGRWMPPMRSMLQAVFSRFHHKKVRLKRK